MSINLELGHTFGRCSCRLEQEPAVLGVEYTGTCRKSEIFQALPILAALLLSRVQLGTSTTAIRWKLHAEPNLPDQVLYRWLDNLVESHVIGVRKNQAFTVPGLKVCSLSSVDRCQL